MNARKIVVIAALSFAAGLMCPVGAYAMNQGVNIDPSQTDGGTPPAANQITTNNGNGGQHYVNMNALATSMAVPTLVVFLGGSQSAPSAYQHFIDNAANRGFSALSLAYPNNAEIAGVYGCNPNSYSAATQDACLTQTRGTTAFGQTHMVSGAPVGPNTYAGGPYDDSGYVTGNQSSGGNSPVSQGDSIMNRLICLIDYLQYNGPTVVDGNVNPNYWSHFLITDSSSPYTRPHSDAAHIDYATHVRVDWSRIVLAGHSQGAAEAAFMAMRLPNAVKRVFLLSGPQDFYSTNSVRTSATWITTTPVATSLSAFWGLRNAAEGDADEGAYGDFVTTNWIYLGSGTSTSYGLGGNGLSEGNAGDGSTVPLGSTQRYKLTAPSGGNHTALFNHNRDAVDSYLYNSGSFLMPVFPIFMIWNHMLGMP